MRIVLQDLKLLIEPSSAVAVLPCWQVNGKQKARVGIILSGGMWTSSSVRSCARDHQMSEDTSPTAAAVTAAPSPSKWKRLRKIVASDCNCSICRYRVSCTDRARSRFHLLQGAKTSSPRIKFNTGTARPLVRGRCG